jgi:hypothetical protein
MIASELEERTRVRAPRFTRFSLSAVAVGGIVVGAWALFAPSSFYSEFPGMGRHWVAIDGPYNEHLLRDVGGLNLALALVTIVAEVRLTPTIVASVSAAWLVYSVPHLIYHATHQGMLESSDYVFEIVSLSVNVVLPAIVLFMALTGSPRAGSLASAPD